jgi:hypothetical protein
VTGEHLASLENVGYVRAILDGGHLVDYVKRS